MSSALVSLKVRHQNAIASCDVADREKAFLTDWLRTRKHNQQAAAERIILDPKYHDLLTVLKGARNGAVYGTKVRFPHALVYADGPAPPTAWVAPG